MGEIQRDTELRSMFAEKLIKPFLRHMENIYRARIETGEFRRMEPEIVVRLIGSMIIGMSILKMTEGEASPLNRISQEKLGDEIINFILRGLLKPAIKS